MLGGIRLCRMVWHQKLLMQLQESQAEAVKSQAIMEELKQAFGVCQAENASLQKSVVQLESEVSSLKVRTGPCCSAWPPLVSLGACVARCIAHNCPTDHL